MKNIRYLLAGLFISFIFFGLIEVSLRVEGFNGKTAFVYNSFFESELFVADPMQKMVRTNSRYLKFFHDQELNPEKKKGSTRVFSVGGSSTYGWGLKNPLEESFIGVFKQKFRETFPEKDIETINAGGIGYGSFRTSVLMKTLLQYQPDLILVFTGHNEFWEYPIYRELYLKRFSVLRLSRLLSRLRIWKLLNELIVPGQQREYNIPVMFTGAYEVFDDAKYAFVKKRFRMNIEEIVRDAKEADVQIIFSTLPANLRVNPAKDEELNSNNKLHRDGLEPKQLAAWNKAYKSGMNELKKKKYNKAIEYFLSAEKIDSRNARLYHYMGKSYEGLGAMEQAYEAYWKHIEKSRRLIVREFNQIIRDVCKKENVPFIDGMRIIEDMAPHRLTGYELFIDSMHPNKITHRVLGETFFQKYKTLD